MEIKTVRIIHDDVPSGMVIEEADFDPKVHKLFPVKEAEPPPKDETDDWTKDEIIQAAFEQFGATLNPASKKSELLAAYREMKG